MTPEETGRAFGQIAIGCAIFTGIFAVAGALVGVAVWIWKHALSN